MAHRESSAIFTNRATPVITTSSLSNATQGGAMLVQRVTQSKDSQGGT